MALAIENVSFAFGRIPALREVSARSEPGRIIALIGPNAAGKSTLLRCIVGALRPQHGHIVLNGEDPHRLSARALARQIAYVAQRSRVSAMFTVQQVVELGRYALAPDARATAQAIGDLDLASLTQRPYNRLSVGQQQRVALARALAQAGENAVIALDEPTSAMDLRYVRLVLRVLRERTMRGATILMTTHDLPLAASIADECWLLDAGRLVATGPMRDVLEPGRLEQVFGVRFSWISDERGRARLLPELSLNDAMT